VLLQVLCPGTDALTETESWARLTSWMKSHGAFVHDGLTLNASCDTTGARGLITTAPLAANTTILQIPKKLMILEDTSSSSSSTDQQVRELLGDAASRLALALALKMRKGTKSAYSPYLSLLPQPTDFHSFHPAFASRSLHADFADLPVLGLLERARSFSAKKGKHAFEAWKSTKSSPASKLSWDDMEAALHLVRSRGTSLNKLGSVLIPGYDLMNTAGNHEANVVWSHEDAVVSVKTKADLPANTEILNSYGKDHDNEVMLHSWGVYLASNPRYLAKATMPVKCFATWEPGLRPSATARSLREATEDMLDLSAAKQASAAGLNSPPCKGELLSASSQGQLRCSLARLAWEACAGEWGLAGHSKSAAKAEGSSLRHHAWAHLEIGTSLAKEGDEKGADEHLEAVLKLQPLNFTANVMLGIARHAQKDLAAAKRHYLDALRTNPMSSKVHMYLGKVMVAQGDLKLGELAFRSALKADPKNSEAQLLLQNLPGLKGKHGTKS